MLFVLILLLSLLPRFYMITNPATYHLHPIRQFQGAMIAKNFYEGGMNVLDPRLDAGIGKSIPPSPIAIEFNLMPYIVALSYKIFGVHEYLGNLLGILFYIGSSILFFLLARKFLRDEFALLAALVFCFSPESFKYSRTFMPDFEVLFFALGALYFFDKYLKGEKWENWLLSLLFLALTFLTKINYLFVVGIIGIMALAHYGTKAFVKPKLWLLGALSLIPSA